MFNSNKKITNFLLLLVIFFAVSFLFSNPSVVNAACITGDFAGGAGTVGDPWQISTPTQLANLSTCTSITHTDKYYILNNNIDLNVSPYNTGSGWTPIGTSGSNFYGKFNGNNYTISNLFINTASSYRGLFGYTQSSTIENLVLTNINITSTQTFVGGLVGYSTTSSVITNVSVSGTISSSSSSVGGLVGYTNLTTISDSDSSVTVSGTSSVGGLVGSMNGTNNSNATITNSYATGNVRGSTNVGGLIGFKYYGTVTDSYATGDILGDKDGGLTNAQSGGFVGTPCLGVITESYATGDVYGDSDLGGFGGQSHNCGGTISNSYSLGSVYPSVSGTGGAFMRYIYLGTVTNSYSIGSVDGQTNAGFIYYDHTCSSCTNNFWDTQISGQSTGGIFSGGRATGKTTVQMKDQSTYTSWDFSTIWNINGSINNGYPYLRWQPVDVTAPTISSVSSDKANGSYKAGEVIDIDVTFSEIVTSTGNVTVTLETGATDRTCTFTVTSSTTGTCNYTVEAGDTTSDLTVNTISGTIADQLSNAMSDFVPTTNLAANKALVIDTTDPALQSLTPVDNETNFSPISVFLMTFNQLVDVETGNITIKKTSDDSTVETISVSGGLVTGTGTTIITIDPSTNLSDLTEYYILVDATAFDDAAGNSYAGISSTTAWSFTTGDINAPILSSITATPTTTEATITWTTNEISSSSVSYGPTVLYGTTTSEADTSPRVISHSVSITGLTCATEYNYIVISKDAANYTSSDTNHTFTTSACPVVVTNSGGAVSVPFLQELSDRLRGENVQVQTQTETVCKFGELYSTNTGYPCAKYEDNPETLIKNDKFIFTKNLKLFVIDEEVKKLQEYLNNNGYTISAVGPGSKGNETTKFGSLTKKALARFQTDNSIRCLSKYLCSGRASFFYLGFDLSFTWYLCSLPICE